MLTGMTKKQEEIGFTINGIHYYYHNFAYYRHTAGTRPIRISKHVFVEALDSIKGKKEKMTTHKAISILKNERECVVTASLNNCNRNCKTCPLVKDTDEILAAYDVALKMLESKPESRTVDEVRVEAKELGYNLIKQSEHVKVSPCICGRKKIGYWGGPEGYFRRCPHCDFEGPAGKTVKEATINWNKAVATAQETILNEVCKNEF